MTDGLKDNHRNAIIDILSANERVERAVLFGSRAMETFTPASDIDIALYGDLLTLTDQANLATAIDELPMAQRVDLLLHATVNNEALCKHIEEHGIEWYRRGTAERLDLPRRYRDQIETLLRGHVPGVEVWAYGSRVTGKSHKGSDLDLVLRGPDLKQIPSGQLMDLIEALEESNVPIIVQAHDWARLPESFHREIEREYVVLIEKEERGIVGERVHCTLADACSAINYGLTASASTDSTGPKFLRITDIVSGQLDWNTVPHVVADNDSITKYRLYDGDIVIARTGASTGASLYVKNPPIAVFASYLVRLQAKPDFDARFLAYYLKSKEFAEFIRSVLGDKSAQPNASASTMTAAPLSAPKDKTEQRAIAHILGTLDDKIELNRRMNETLEEMAQALFKSWFVDFDPVRAKMEGRDTGLPPDVAALFPDRLVESELGKIPEGWEVGCFGSIVSPIKNRVGEREAVVLSAISRGELVKSGEYFTKQVYSKSIANYLTVEQWDIAYNPSRINIGSIGMLKESFLGAVSPVYVVIRPQPAYRWYLEFTLQLYQVKEWISTLASGSVRQSLPCQDFMSIPCVIPPHPIIQRFDEEWKHLHRISMARANESRTLSSLRDTLLPKLISGEMRVNTWDEESEAIGKHQ